MAHILIPEPCSQCTQQFDHLKRNLEIKVKYIQAEFNEKLIDFVNLANYLDNVFEDFLSSRLLKFDHTQVNSIKLDSSTSSASCTNMIESRPSTVKTDEDEIKECDQIQHDFTTTIVEDHAVEEQIHEFSHCPDKRPMYVCDICPKTLTTKTGLVTHRRTHTREKWHECDICQKSFAQKNTLIVHMRTHTNERPFMCHRCSRTFNQPSTFRRHMLKHDGIKPFQCTLCERTFVEKTKLAVHMLTHTGQRPHVCPICKRGYTKKCHVKKHVKKFHNIADADSVLGPINQRRSNIRSAPFGL